MIFSRQSLCIGLLAAASLLFESTLTRLLAVTQFYHFAFLVVSLALLGYGISGTVLSVFPSLLRRPLNQVLILGVIGFIFTSGLSYGVVNFLPFDSYAIAWDQRQIYFFFIYYLALTLPFTMSGLAAGSAIARSAGKSHLIYAANLLGSGIGVLLAPVAMWFAGVPGAVLLSMVIGLAGIYPLSGMSQKIKRPLIGLASLLVFVAMIGFCALSILNLSSNSPLGLILSPYKGLAQAHRYPGVNNIYGRWNALARVDVLKNAGTHHLPGLSYQYKGAVPAQLGLSLDAESLQPITPIAPDSFPAAEYLPEHIGFKLQPNAYTLVVEPGGGLGILQALVGHSGQITVVISNPLERNAVAETSGDENIYVRPGVRVEIDTGRIFLERSSQEFDIIYYPLTDEYRPVSSGAYSLGEEYLYTVDSIKAALKRLSPNGLIIITRWLQVPPSESLRLAATLVEALERTNPGNPGEKLVLFRGIQTMTAIVKPSGWNPDELIQVRAFTDEKRFDLVWVPDIQEEEVNRFNRLPEPVYYQNIRTLLQSTNRAAYFDSYPFDIHPVTDEKPFFFHFFKWEQTPEILSTMGHVWQPFGGSGYLVTVALFLLVLILSLLLILLPVFFRRGNPSYIYPSRIPWRPLFYFGGLGIGFMFIEIPFIQRMILYLGHPISAFTAVVFSILLFSSIGSALVRHRGFRSGRWLIVLVVFAIIVPPSHRWMITSTLDWTFIPRLLLTVLTTAPLALLMGIPFPLGLAVIEKKDPDIIPWIWAVNGSTSVVASILAAMIGLTFGFGVVLSLGGMMYATVALRFLLGINSPGKIPIA
jgi:hypothetical protein